MLIQIRITCERKRELNYQMIVKIDAASNCHMGVSPSVHLSSSPVIQENDKTMP